MKLRSLLPFRLRGRVNKLKTAAFIKSLGTQLPFLSDACIGRTTLLIETKTERNKRLIILIKK